MLNKFLFWTKIPHRIDGKIFKRALLQYPYNSESSGSYIRNITKVEAIQTGGKVKVYIESHSPGVFIGKAGKQIKEIEELMSRMSNLEVEIDIKETELFQHLY